MHASRLPNTPTILALLAGLLALAGCSSPEDPARALADYNTRIERIVGRDLPVTAPVGVPTWPAIGEIEQPVTDIRVGVLASLDQARCSMLGEVRKRYTGIGGELSRAQRLLYEMRLLRALRQCETTTADGIGSADPKVRDFATAVRNVLEVKHRDLPAVYWNATFGATEFREFFSVAALPVRLGEITTAGNSANAIVWLATLGTLSPGAPLPASEAIENQYFQLIGTKMGGRLWMSLDLATRELDRSSTLLEDLAGDSTLCPGGRPDARAQQLHDLYATHYVQRLQPWLARIARDSDAVANALEKLWSAQKVSPPPAVTQYRERTFGIGPAALRPRFANAVRRHALAWKGILEPCGLTPRFPASP